MLDKRADSARMDRLSTVNTATVGGESEMGVRRVGFDRVTGAWILSQETEGTEAGVEVQTMGPYQYVGEALCPFTLSRAVEVRLVETYGSIRRSIRSHEHNEGIDDQMVEVLESIWWNSEDLADKVGWGWGDGSPERIGQVLDTIATSDSQPDYAEKLLVTGEEAFLRDDEEIQRLVSDIISWHISYHEPSEKFDHGQIKLFESILYHAVRTALNELTPRDGFVPAFGGEIQFGANSS